MESLDMTSVVGRRLYNRSNIWETYLSPDIHHAHTPRSYSSRCIRTYCSKMPQGADGITTPLPTLRVSRHMIPHHARFPNCSVQHHPLMIYHGALHPSATASQIEAHLRQVGVMEPQWRYTMYPFSHFHSNTHEFLCIANGRARLCFGGEENPDRVEAEVEKGDALLVPAGVAHRLLVDLQGGFEMVGSYPKGGPQWDMCYGREGEEKASQRISTLEWVKSDPLYGEDGPAVEDG